MRLRNRMPQLFLYSVLGPLLALAPACVDNDGPSLVVLGNGLFDDECRIDPANPELVLRGALTVLTGLETSYEIQPVFQNQLPNLASTAGRSDPNTILVRGAVVRLINADDRALIPFSRPNPFSIDMSVVVPSAAEITNPGLAVGSVTIIPQPYVQELRGILNLDAGPRTVVAEVEFFGETTGQNNVESSEYIWPITVTAGVNAPGVVCGLAPGVACTPCRDFNRCPISVLGVCECLQDTDCPGTECNAGTCGM